MKNTLVHLCAPVALTGLFTAGLVVGKDTESTEKMNPQMAEMMKKVEAAGAPGDAHKLLEPLIGEWTAEVQCWTTPGGPPTLSKGTSKAQWAMQGRFVQEEFNGEMIGKPFQMGYDNQKDCPITGERNMPVRQVLRIISADKHTYEMHATIEGKESQTMEIIYTRK